MFKKLFFKQDIWAISINRYQEGEALDTTVMKPTITAADVTDCKAIFVADPFLIKHEEFGTSFMRYYLNITVKGLFLTHTVMTD